MTILTGLKAISLTQGAVSSGRAAGTHLPDLLTNAQTRAVELQLLMKQIVAFHPNGDTNLAALNAIVTELG